MDDAPRLPVRFDPRFLRTFVLTALLLALLLPLFTLTFVRHYDNPDLAWINDLYARKTLLASHASKPGRPRLLVIGGSSVLFGVDASLLQSKLHRPALNLGTHAGLSLPYLLDRAARLARPGDTLLLSIEYPLLSNPEPFWSYRRDMTLTYDPFHLRTMTPRQLALTLYGVPLPDYLHSFHAWQHRLIGPPDFHPYSLATLDDHGDINLTHLPGHRPDEPIHRGFIPSTYDPASLAQLRDFIARARAQGMRVLASWPPQYLDDSYAASSAWFPSAEPLRQLFASAGVPVVDTPGRSAFPRDLFLDTAFHLSPAGRRLRTEHLIADLRPYLTPAPPQSSAPSRQSYPPSTRNSELGTKNSPLPPILLLGTHAHTVTPANTFANDLTVQYKFLLPHPTDFPDALTPDQLSTLVRAGRTVYFDPADPALADAIQSAGLSSKNVATAHTTLPAFLSAHPDHVFLLVLAGTDRPPIPATDDLPPSFRRFLSATGYRAAILGTGRTADTHRIYAAPKPVTLPLPAGGHLTRSWHAPFDIHLRAAPNHSALLLDGYDLLPPDSPPALWVAALHPTLGTLSALQPFPTPTATTYRLSQLLPAATSSSSSSSSSSGNSQLATRN